MSTKAVSDYSMLDHETQSDPFDFYALLHEECPVYQMPETGFYMVTKYEDMRRVLKDSDIFTSDIRRTSGLQGDGKANLYQDILADRGWSHVQTLQRTDPPEHTRYRKLLDRVFTAKRVRGMVPYIEGVTNELIDDWIDDGETDFIAGFAMPQPGIIIAEQLGLDRSQVETFKTWADAMLATAIKPLNEDELRATAEIELEAQHFFAKIFEDRRTSPGDDLMSGFVHAHGEDEEPLSMHELQNLMHQLITGGFETTQSALAHSMWILLRYPELQDRLRDDPSLIKSFVEEALRFESPVQGLSRMTTKDVDIGGITIPANSMVVVRYGAANRDPEKFECPNQFDLDRKNAGAHIAFGMGAHFCVGAMLARQEMVSAVTHILRRMKNIHLKTELPYPVHDTSLFFLPIREMHIAFDKID
jgi:cytochrome P450